MKKFAILLVLTMVASSAFAIIDDGTSSLGCYSDAGGESNCFTVEPLTPFNIYWVFANPDIENLGGFEFAWRLEPETPHFMLGYTMPPGALNIGNATNMIVGLGLGLISTEATVLVTHEVMFSTAVANVVITGGPATPDSIDGEAAYNDYNNPGDLRVMNWSTVSGPADRDASGWLINGLAKINGDCPPPVASETATWGNMKALWN